MNFKNRYLLVLAFLIFLAGCKSKQTKEVESASYTSLVDVNTTSLDSLNLENFVKDIEFVVFETRPEAMIENIDKLVFEDDKFFVYDKKQKTIFIYSSSGTFVKKIFKAGNANDEYVRIDDFYIDVKDESVYILDMISKRILKYDFNANLVKSYRLGFHADSFYKLEDGGYVFSISGNVCNSDFCDQIIFCDDNFNVVKTFVPIQPKLKGFVIETPTRRLVKASDDLFRYIDIDDMIYSFKDGDLKDMKRVNFMKDNLDLSFYDTKFVDGGEFLTAVIDNKKANWIHNYLENDLFIVFKYFMNRKTYSYIYSKESNKGMALRKLDSDFITVSPLLIKENTFFEYQNPVELLRNSEGPMSTIDSLLYSRLRSEFPLIDETQNPLIIKYSVRF